MQAGKTKQVEAEYLGDAAYARWEAEVLVIFTHNGIHPTNSVYLEPKVLRSLLDYLRRCGLTLDCKHSLEVNIDAQEI